MASRTEQEAKGHLERQKITDEAEGKISLFINCNLIIVILYS